ncbi:GPW/gp25 family protein [Enterobacter roggenkampii]|uniref:GPW/gp25 family protein n=1 Tax=Enterobacter roggenkampii TaxID=1812935 RepID=UPI002DBB5EFA|nr:GPW/gp25 family protein [Enterobacter roggenkampii]MEB5890000.1 GPW/gp25 family protein [Enterobacter roggenkampii]
MKPVSPLTRLYGQGWAFPPRFTQEGVIMAEGAESVRQSLMVLLRTQPGERIMRAAFGCDLQQFLFLGITSELMADIRSHIQDCVLRYEPRADVMDIQITPSREPGTLDIVLQYRLAGSQINQSLTTLLDVRDGPGVR